MKNYLKWVGLGVLILFIILATDFFEFGPKSSGQNPPFYPPTQEFKSSVEQVLDEALSDRIFDILWKRTFHYLTLFESLDGWGQTLVGAGSSISIANDKVTLTTDANTNDSANLFKQPDNQGLITFSQKSRMRTRIELSSVANQTIYITIGNIQGGGQGYGFKIVNNTLKGVVDDGTTENTVDLQTLSASTEYTLEARYEPNVGVIFFADDSPNSVLITEVGKLSSNLPSPANVTNDNFAYFYIRTDTTAAKTMFISMLEYLQARGVLK